MSIDSELRRLAQEAATRVQDRAAGLHREYLEVQRHPSELKTNLVRLLTRSTRSVAPTEAGERLVQTVGPHFDGIDAGLAALTAMRKEPAGSLRITSVEHASDTILTFALARLLPNYPDIRVEIINDYGLTDIVAARYDAGVRVSANRSPKI